MSEPEVRYEISKPHRFAAEFLAFDNEPKWRGFGPVLIGQFPTREAARAAVDDYEREAVRAMGGKR